MCAKRPGYGPTVTQNSPFLPQCQTHEGMARLSGPGRIPRLLPILTRTVSEPLTNETAAFYIVRWTIVGKKHCMTTRDIHTLALQPLLIVCLCIFCHSRVYTFHMWIVIVFFDSALAASVCVYIINLLPCLLTHWLELCVRRKQRRSKTSRDWTKSEWLKRNAKDRNFLLLATEKRSPLPHDGLSVVGGVTGNYLSITRFHNYRQNCADGLFCTVPSLVCMEWVSRV